MTNDIVASDPLTVTVPAHGPLLAQVAAGGATATIPWPVLRLGDTPLAAPDDHAVEVETEGGRESEMIVRAEFEALHKQLVLSKQKHALLLETLRQLEVLP